MLHAEECIELVQYHESNFPISFIGHTHYNVTSTNLALKAKCRAMCAMQHDSAAKIHLCQVGQTFSIGLHTKPSLRNREYSHLGQEAEPHAGHGGHDAQRPAAVQRDQELRERALPARRQRLALAPVQEHQAPVVLRNISSKWGFNWSSATMKGMQTHRFCHYCHCPGQSTCHVRFINP